MILVYPIFHTFEHELAHQWLFRSRFIATARTVGKSSISILAIVVIGISQLEIAVLNVESMVVNHVENNTYTSLVKCLDHLFELTNAHVRAVRIGGIAAFRHVIVFRVIAPVIRRIMLYRFVNRGIIERREQVDSGHTKPFQIVC